MSQPASTMTMPMNEFSKIVRALLLFSAFVGFDSRRKPAHATIKDMMMIASIASPSDICQRLGAYWLATVRSVSSADVGLRTPPVCDKGRAAWARYCARKIRIMVLPDPAAPWMTRCPSWSRMAAIFPPC